MTAELDPELQAYAEAAIQTFRSSFDAALAEMRAAARTTIVLDR